MSSGFNIAQIMLETFLSLRAIQGHSGNQKIDPTLQDLVVIPEGFAPHIFPVGSSHDLHSIITSGLIAGGKDGKQGKTNSILCGREPYGLRALR